MLTFDPRQTYDWAAASADFLYGEPDCTYVIRGHAYDITISPQASAIMLAASRHLAYGDNTNPAETN